MPSLPRPSSAAPRGRTVAQAYPGSSNPHPDDEGNEGEKDARCQEPEGPDSGAGLGELLFPLAFVRLLLLTLQPVMLLSLLLVVHGPPPLQEYPRIAEPFPCS